MARKLSTNQTVKREVRDIWCRFIEKLHSEKNARISEDTTASISIATITTEGFWDVRRFLQLEFMQPQDVTAITNQSHLSKEFELMMISEFGLDKRDSKRLFFGSNIESVLDSSLQAQRFDVYNLDFSGHFFTPSGSVVHSSRRDPQGVSAVFRHASRFSRSFTVFLTSNIDSKSECGHFESANQMLTSYFKDPIVLLPSSEKPLLESWAAIMMNFAAVALGHGYSIGALYPFVYSPTGEYWLQMTIVQFEPLWELPIEHQIIESEDRSQNIRNQVGIIRSTIPRIRILKEVDSG